MKKLSDLSFGETGRVKKVGSFGSLRRRIIDMGITPGTNVKMIKCAPMGDPVEISVHGYNLSIRKSEAGQIEIFDIPDNASESLKKDKKIFIENKKHAVSFAGEISKGEKIFKAALIGNPNSGKTTLFNALTGSFQYVGNWPGVTVGRKEGRIKNVNLEIDLVDLPGVYSLSPYSPEEIVTRNYILNERPDVIINILDATNLERNLYLTTQLLELDFKVIPVLNMTDLLLKKGQKIDCRLLEEKLGVPVIAVSAGKNSGMENLLSKLSQVVTAHTHVRYAPQIYSSGVEEALKNLDAIVNTNKKYVHDSRFKLVKILENDPLITAEMNFDSDTMHKIESVRKHLGDFYDKDQDIIVADERYSYACALCAAAVKSAKNGSKLSFSDKTDKLITGKYTAFPCFLAVVISIFYVTFGPFGVMLKRWCEDFINTNMHHTVGRILNYIGASPWSKSLVLDAVIGGVGAVVAFLPQVIILFTLLSLLEDCGYMARAAFIMDKPFRKLGLSGKAFVPMIMGFGCTVPAVLGTKILESKKDKKLAVFLIPFMSCSAKMPIYLLFASAFFPKHQTAVIFSLYVLGVIVAVLTSFIFKGNLFKDEESPFIMEMPEYKMPSPKNVWMSVWDRTKDFIERAGTVILIATVVIWFLQSFGTDFKWVGDNSQSILASIGNFISPLFGLCGFGSWKACVALLTGLMAKESVVSTLAVLYGSSGAMDLSSVLPSVFSPCSAVSFLIFALLYTPCAAALSAIHREFEDFKLTIVFVVYQFFIAYVLSALAFQIMSLFSKICF